MLFGGTYHGHWRLRSLFSLCCGADVSDYTAVITTVCFQGFSSCLPINPEAFNDGGRPPQVGFQTVSEEAHSVGQWKSLNKLHLCFCQTVKPQTFGQHYNCHCIHIPYVSMLVCCVHRQQEYVTLCDCLIVSTTQPVLWYNVQYEGLHPLFIEQC